jgi:hypothetical protein
MMPMFVKKPVCIEARELTKENLLEMTFWLGGGRTVSTPSMPDGFAILTPEGLMRANIGDYILKGIKGEFYPCKADIFHMTYEKVEEE